MAQPLIQDLQIDIASLAGTSPGDLLQLQAIGSPPDAGLPTVFLGDLQYAATLPAVGSPPASPAVARSVEERLNDHVSLKDFGAKLDGVTDDTVALRGAIESGKSVYLGEGVIVVSAEFFLNTVANHGQIIFGAGSLAKNGSGGDVVGRTIIRPTGAVTKLFTIDGTPFANYLQHFRFQDFTVDMTNMTDAITTCAFNQIQAWGGEYHNVRMINEGSNKRGWIFNAGAFTTTLNNCTSRIFEATGISDGNQVTTLTFLNCDNEQYILNYASAINVTGGATQGSLDKFTGYEGGTPAGSPLLSGMHHVTGLTIRGLDVEGSGTYLKIGPGCNSFFAAGNQLTGFSGTMYDGTPAHPYILLDSVGVGSNPFYMYRGGFKFYNDGAQAQSFLLSGASNMWSVLSLGRTGADLNLVAIANTNEFESGSIAGDGYIGVGGSNTLWLGGGNTKIGNQWSRQLVFETITGSPPAVDLHSAYGSTFSISPSVGQSFTVNALSGTTFAGQIVTVIIRNASGGDLGTTTWASSYRLGPWVNPKTGYQRVITFQADAAGTTFYEISRTPRDVSLSGTAVFGGAEPLEVETVTLTGSPLGYTLQSSDAGTNRMTNTSSPNEIRIPSNASVPFPIGTQILLTQLGTGQMTVTIDTDTLNVNSTFTTSLAGQYSEATITKKTSTMWVLSGDLAAV